MAHQDTLDPTAKHLTPYRLREQPVSALLQEIESFGTSELCDSAVDDSAICSLQGFMDGCAVLAPQPLPHHRSDGKPRGCTAPFGQEFQSLSAWHCPGPILHVFLRFFSNLCQRPSARLPSGHGSLEWAQNRWLLRLLLMVPLGERSGSPGNGSLRRQSCRCCFIGCCSCRAQLAGDLGLPSTTSQVLDGDCAGLVNRGMGCSKCGIRNRPKGHHQRCRHPLRLRKCSCGEHSAA
mmetsp:Transcript_11434/g.29518  ORF Transcript_11434/g.29518 Transcript_11434/m.29518 type:complete len:235 (-) Transcript_11434:1000-1704(-)